MIIKSISLTAIFKPDLSSMESVIGEEYKKWTGG